MNVRGYYGNDRRSPSGREPPQNEKSSSNESYFAIVKSVRKDTKRQQTKDNGTTVFFIVIPISCFASDL